MCCFWILFRAWIDIPAFQLTWMGQFLPSFYQNKVLTCLYFVQCSLNVSISNLQEWMPMLALLWWWCFIFWCGSALWFCNVPPTAHFNVRTELTHARQKVPGCLAEVSHPIKRLETLLKWQNRDQIILLWVEIHLVMTQVSHAGACCWSVPSTLTVQGRWRHSREFTRTLSFALVTFRLASPKYPD